MASKGIKICLAMSLLFLIVTSVIVTISLTIFKSKDPIITLHPTGLENFNFSHIMSNLSANVSLGMMITVKNLNYASFEYTNSTGYVNFHHTIVGEVPMGANFLPARGQINVNTSANVMPAKLIRDPMLFSDFASGTLNFTSTTALPGKAKMFKIIKLKATAYSTCNISIDVNSKNVASNCIYKIKL